MKMKHKIINLKEVPLDDDMSSLILDRIRPLSEKYHHNSLMMNTNNWPLIRGFGLKELMVSCYCQGLLDGNRATEQLLNKQI